MPKALGLGPGSSGHPKGGEANPEDDGVMAALPANSRPLILGVGGGGTMAAPTSREPPP